MSVKGRPKGHKKTGGRKKGVGNVATRELKEMIRSKPMDQVVDAMFDAATGLYVEATLKNASDNNEIVDAELNGEDIKVFRRAPNERAGQVLFEQGYGRPTQRVEGGDEPIKIQITVEDVAEDK
jgi:hypothetical protein